MTNTKLVDLVVWFIWGLWSGSFGGPWSGATGGGGFGACGGSNLGSWSMVLFT